MGGGGTLSPLLSSVRVVTPRSDAPVPVSETRSGDRRRLSSAIVVQADPHFEGVRCSDLNSLSAV